MSKTFKTIPQLLEENKRLLQDKKRLDWLEEQASQSMNWIARESTTGRGYRLHQTRQFQSYNTARAAIDAAMEDAK